MTKSSRRVVAKRAANVSIRGELLDAARAANINLSATFERALAVEIGRVERERWLAENREAIAAQNDFMAKNGMFSDGMRSF